MLKKEKNQIGGYIIRLDQKVDFEPIILPKKTIFQLCSLLESYDGDVKISNVKSKIKFDKQIFEKIFK
jgi:hypothetical protein